MGLVYLPTFTIKKSTIHEGKLTSAMGPMGTFLLLSFSMAQAAAAVPGWGALGSWEQSTFGDPGDGYSWWLL